MLSKVSRKVLLWPGPSGRDAEVDRFGIGASGFQHLHRDVFALGELSHVVFELDFDDHMRDGLVACVGDGSVDVADGGSDEIFCGAHLEIGELEARA